MKESFLFSFFLFLFSFAVAQQPSKGLDAKAIAANYYKGTVKILLYDSTAAKQGIHSGYVGRGSGFIVSENGIVFTNRHVIDLCVYGYMDYEYYDASGAKWRDKDAYSEEKTKDPSVSNIFYTGYATPIVQVYYGKGESEYKLYVAKVLSVGVGSFDGAMLKIVSDVYGNPATAKFFPLPIGNSDAAVQGEDLCVYGYPAQYDGGFDLMIKDMSTLTFGKLSGYDYVFNKDYGYIKTDASINSGNSGGPVFNESNKVIGIATATGMKTSIGLIGGINGMYYVVAPKSEILQQLSAKGLTIPKNAGSINTILGDKKPILSAEELGKISASEGNSTNAYSTTTSSGKSGGTTASDYYKNSKITVHNKISDDGILGTAGSSYDILGDGLDFVYVQVNNYGEALKTTEFIVDVYKKAGDSYSDFVETKTFTVSENNSATHFKYFPPSAGDYRMSVYTKNSVWINDGYATFFLKGSGSTTKTTKTSSDPSSYYAKSKINFTNDETKVLESASYTTEFSIGKEGGFIYVIVDNYPDKLKTDQIIVDVWKKKGSKYENKIETKKYNITDTLDYTFFKYSFFDPGDYRFSVYTKDEVWINSGDVTIKKK